MDPKASGLSEAKRALLEEMRKGRLRSGPARPGIPPRPPGPTPLSFAQQRLWFIHEMDPSNAAYNVPTALRLRGPLSADVLERALHGVIRRHESLRTRFPREDGGPVQKVESDVRPDFRILDLSDLPADTREREAEQRAEAEARAPFDLAQGPLLRATLLRLGPDDHLLLLCMHHIISDGWSMGILVREVATLYDALTHGRASPLEPLPVQYPDFAVWQRDQLQGDTLERGLDYWRTTLTPLPPPLDLPCDRPRPPVQTLRGGVETVTVRPDVASALRELAQAEGATLYMVLLGAFDALLSRLTGETDITVGTGIANRTRSEIEPLIGFFVNALVLRVDCTGDPSFRKLLGRSREAALGAFAHQDLPFDRIVEDLQPPRDLSRNPLFQVALALQNAPAGEFELSDLVVQPVVTHSGATRFDLEFHLWEAADGGIEGFLFYAADLFDASTARRLVEGYAALLVGAADAPDQPISSLPVATEDDLQRARTLSAGGALEYEPRTAWACFEESALRFPDAPALRDGDRTFNYRELRTWAIHAGEALRGDGVRRGGRVGVLADRSAEQIAGILAATYAGAAWVPLDPAQPAARLRRFAELGALDTVLASPGLKERVGELGCVSRVLPAPAGRPSGALPEPDSRPEAADPSEVAYVIFTSGSTGEPNGVAVTHANLSHLVAWYRLDFALTAADRITVNAGPGFDAGVAEIWPALASGACLCVVDPEARLDPGALRDWVVRNGVTIAFVPSLLVKPLVSLPWLDGAGLRILFTGGEALPPLDPDELPFRVANHYGPTETTVVAVAGDIDRGGAHPAPTIGRPITNTHAYVLDGRGQAVPIGVPGELFIGGRGVGVGYVGQPERTAARFLPDPFRGVPGARMYRTGDRVRRLPDGRLEFLGRTDTQVKIRGQRVEPGEIEAVLGEHPGVRAAAVAPRARDGQAILVAYIVPRDGAAEGASGPAFLSALRGWTARRLPPAMVPAAFLALDDLPLTPNGKVDRRALPEPGPARAEDAVFVEPRTDVERAIARAWCDVLAVPRVSATDHFFELGGHSLLATQVLSRLRTSLGVAVPLQALFESPVLEDLAAHVGRQRPAPAPPRPRRDASGPAPLSFAQQRLWFLDRLEPDTAAYHIPNALRLRGDLDARALGQAFTEIVRRHEALRTRFVDGPTEPEQHVAPPFTVTLDPEPVAGATPEERERTVRSRVAEEAARPFDLGAGRLLRARLLQLGPQDHVLSLVTHHIASDGWSIGVMVRELSALYAAFVAGSGRPLPPLPIQYADWAVWQRDWLDTDERARQLAFWRRTLAGVPPLELPADRPRPAHPTYAGSGLEAPLDRDVVARLREIGAAQGATLHMTLLAAFAAVLGRWSRQTDFAIGTPVAGRTREETEPLIGFFVNTLAIRADLSGPGLSFTGLLRRVREAALAAHAHQDVPFERIVEELQPDRDTSRNPLFQVLFVLQNVAFGELALPGVSAASFDLESRTAQFDLELSVLETEAGVSAQWNASTDLFDRATLARLAAHFGAFIAAISEDPEGDVAGVAILTDAERALHRALHDTERDVDAPDSLVALWEDAVDRYPAACAVRHGDDSLSYAELEARANRIAHLLRKHGVARGGCVGICVPRGPDLIAAVLAVRKAGGAYVSLDPEYPADRLAHMITPAGAGVVLTTSAVADRLPEGAAAPLRLDRLEEDLARQPETRIVLPVSDDDIAYVVYTSGSTGRPKGIAMREGPLRNLIAWQRDRSIRGPGRRTLQYSSLSFDVSFQELFATFGEGGTLVLLSEEERRDPAELLRVLSRERVQRLFLPFVALQALAETAEIVNVPLALEEVITAGEQLRITPALRRFFSARPGVTLDNQYGPSEAHVVTAECLEGPPESWPELPPIGRPLPNVRIHVLDPAGAPAPIDVAGEVFVGGPVLARGYLAQPDLTADRFLPDPARNGGRLYATGDLARVRPDGRLVFAGRRDRQVKVRGYRVEPAEVEAALANCPGVRDAIVDTRTVGGAGSRLVAWVILEEGAGNADALRDALAPVLPEYLIPSVFLPVQDFPRTPSGKVDRQALPAPRAGAPTGATVPRTPEEELACSLFADVLDLERVGRSDNFFDLGGHSLLAVRLLTRVSAAFGAEVPVRVLFEAPTPALLARAAAAARRAGKAPPPPLRPAGEEDRRRLSYAQQRLWFLDRLDPGGVVYNLNAALRLTGRLNRRALSRTLTELDRRHESLRTRFRTGADEPGQVFDPPGRDLLRTADLRAEAAPRAAAERRISTEAGTPFDLERGPLWRALLLRTADREYVLSLVFHHIVTDGWSMDRILAELVALYDAFAVGRAVPWPDLPVQYADWAAWQRTWLEGGELERQTAYWREELRDLTPLELPTDFARPPRRGLRAGTVRFSIPAEDAGALARTARAGNATLFHALFACFHALLSRVASTDDVVIGTPVANRGPRDAEGIVGFFSNTLALRARIDGRATFRERIAAIRDRTLAALDNQDAPFETIVDALDVERDLSRNPLFDVMFALQHGDASGPPPESIRVETLATESGATPFDLAMALSEERGGIAGTLQFDADLFERATVERMAGYFRKLVQAAAHEADRPLPEIELRTGAERALVAAANAFPGPAPEHTLTELWDRACRGHAGETAVRDAGGSITYAELDAWAVRLADTLQRAGVGPEVPVGLVCHRGLAAFAGLFGIWKAGGVAVPLDADQPAERLSYLLRDAGIRLVVAEPSLTGVLPEPAPRVVPLVRNDARDEAAGRGPAPAALSPANAAYIIYTSGSTGMPKGSVVEHRAIASHALSAAEDQGFRPGDCGLHALPLSFDAALDEFLPPLLRGATLVVHPDPRGDTPGDFLDRCEREGITVAHIPLGLFHDMAFDIGAGRPIPERLRCVILGGETPQASRIATFLRHARPGVVVTNAYGPTEAVVAATRHDIRAAEDARDPTPIGRARPYTSVHILDGALHPAPLGALGEIHLGGPLLARGYLGRADATAETFVPDPFSAEPGARMYRTGDFGRRRADGTLVFTGRRDGQVKLRGFRIELGEVQTALARLPGIREAVVAVRGAGADRYLAAWVAAVDASALTPAAVRNALREHLPGHMIPARVVVLDGLPKNARGKVDRAALPEPTTAGAAERRIGPRDERERLLEPHWCRTLGLQSVHVEENFFEAGGNSLLAMRLVTAVRRAIGRDIPVATLFRQPTYEDFARALGEEDGGDSGAALVRLRAGSTRAPLVCFTGVGGGIADFRELAERLSPGRAVYVVPALGGDVPARIEDAAAAILPEIRRRVPDGPVHLLGWSYGGLVAFETARRLTEAGRRVGALLIVDALAPGAYHDLDTPDLSDAVPDDDGLLGPDPDPDPEARTARRAEVRTWLSGVEDRVRAARTYRAKPWAGSAVVIRGRESVTVDLGDDALGWTPWVTGELSVDSAPGNHDTILHGPGAEAIAALAERQISRFPRSPSG